MNSKTFSLILPTRDHPTLVMQLFESIVKTASMLDSLEIVLYADNDDIESQSLAHPLLSISRITGEAKTIGGITQECYEKSRGKYIILANDDMVFRTKAWDARVLAAFSKFSDEIALVYGNDLYYGKRMSTFPILSRTACDLMGKICPVEYHRHCIDPHILDIFKRLEKLGFKRTVYLGNVIFEHMHNELGILISDPETVPRNDIDDQELYFKFSDYRQQIAEKLANHIKNQQMIINSKARRY